MSATDSPAASHISEGAPVPGRDNELTRRALYYTPPNSFTFSLPKIPAHLFKAERDAAFDPKAPTGIIPLDLGAHYETGFPATTPMMLMRYLRFRGAATLSTTFKASGEIYYALAGRGTTTKGATKIDWRQGDLFLLPGGGETVHTTSVDALLYSITNEPQLAFERAEPPLPGHAAILPVLYPAEEIERQWNELCVVRGNKEIAGKAVLFTSQPMSAMRTCMPTITVGLNVFEPGDDQLAHRHNAAAVTLCIEAGPGAYSRIDSQRFDWLQGGVMITPPQAAHSHHNEGKQRMLALVLQDSGLYYHTRAVGFSFVK